MKESQAVSKFRNAALELFPRSYWIKIPDCPRSGNTRFSPMKYVDVFWIMPLGVVNALEFKVARTKQKVNIKKMLRDIQLKALRAFRRLGIGSFVVLYHVYTGAFYVVPINRVPDDTVRFDELADFLVRERHRMPWNFERMRSIFFTDLILEQGKRRYLSDKKLDVPIERRKAIVELLNEIFEEEV